MEIFLFIILHNIVPIFTVIFVGFIIGKSFKLDIKTLSKFNFYVFVPSFIFTKLYSSDIPLKMIDVVAIVAVLFLWNLIIPLFICKIRKHDKKFVGALTNSMTLFNSGNIGIPLITLVFSSAPFVIDGKTPYLAYALTCQIMIMAFQTIMSNTLGFIIVGKAHVDLKTSIIKVLKMPAIYAIILAFALKFVPYNFEQIPVWPAFTYMADGLIPIALLTLGVQLTKTKFRLSHPDVYISNFFRLIISPLVVLCLVYLFGIHGVMAEVLIIGTSAPTAVNAALIAVEYDNHADFVSQTVLSSTILCSITLVFVIYLARILFPV
ncbi:MAG: AEC family transporter [Clostridium perfringens]|nr:AEC family transporter [Clostridium perfringens]